MLSRPEERFKGVINTCFLAGVNLISGRMKKTLTVIGYLIIISTNMCLRRGSGFDRQAKSPGNSPAEH